MVRGKVVALGLISINKFNCIVFEERGLNIVEKLGEVFVVYTLDLHLSVHFETTVVIGEGCLQFWIVKVLRAVSSTIPHSLCQTLAYFDSFGCFIDKLWLPCITTEAIVLDQGWKY